MLLFYFNFCDHASFRRLPLASSFPKALDSQLFNQFEWCRIVELSAYSGAVWRVKSTQRIESLCTDMSFLLRNQRLRNPPRLIAWSEVFSCAFFDAGLGWWEPWSPMMYQCEIQLQLESHPTIYHHELMISVTIGGDPPMQDSLENIRSNRFP